MRTKCRIGMRPVCRCENGSGEAIFQRLLSLLSRFLTPVAIHLSVTSPHAVCLIPLAAAATFSRPLVVASSFLVCNHISPQRLFWLQSSIISGVLILIQLLAFWPKCKFVPCSLHN